MLFRFCLYGFLKNQRYFEPFLVLIFLEKGLTFFQIGVLIAIRELTVNALEIVSGAVADIYGRRASMVFSFASYIVSFIALGLAQEMTFLAVGMAFYGVGDAFRTGTHKSMIFTWLRLEGREDERTEVYGTTRSWSKIGSAVSALIAAGFVLFFNTYNQVLFIAIVPYVLGVINFMGYPAALDGDLKPGRRPSEIVAHLKSALLQSLKQTRLRALLFESMGFEGAFRSTKDYLQPALQAAALALWAAFGIQLSSDFGEARQVALLVGPVYFVLFLLSAAASRRAGRFQKRYNGPVRASSRLWMMMLLTFAAMIPALYLNEPALAIPGFVVLYLLQNLWRPIILARVDSECDAQQQATVLSIEQQAVSFGTMILAPVLGAGVDWASTVSDVQALWPVPLVGGTVALVGSLVSARRARRES